MELGSPLALDLQFVGFTVLFVKDLKVNSVAAFVEAGHDVIYGGKKAAVLAILEGFD